MISTTDYDRYAIAAQEDRCAPRTRLKIPASLRPSGDKGFATTVHDLSLGGFSCEALSKMLPTDRVPRDKQAEVALRELRNLKGLVVNSDHS